MATERTRRGTCRAHRFWRAVLVWSAVRALALAPSASATNQNCWGKVLQIKQWANSQNGPHGYIGILYELTDSTKRTRLNCSTRPDLDNPNQTVQDCHQVFSLFALAKGLGSLLHLNFSDIETIPNTTGGIGATTCQEIAEWHAGTIPHLSIVSVL